MQTIHRPAPAMPDLNADVPCALQGSERTATCGHSATLRLHYPCPCTMTIPLCQSHASPIAGAILAPTSTSQHNACGRCKGRFTTSEMWMTEL